MDDHFANDTWRCNDYVQQQFFVEESIHGGSVKAAGSGGKDFGSTLTAINMEGEDPFMSGGNGNLNLHTPSPELREGLVNPYEYTPIEFEGDMNDISVVYGSQSSFEDTSMQTPYSSGYSAPMYLDPGSIPQELPAMAAGNFAPYRPSAPVAPITPHMDYKPVVRAAVPVPQPPSVKDGYIEKRKKNNDAVRKSRLKAKVRQQLLEERYDRLLSESKGLEKRVRELEKEIKMEKWKSDVLKVQLDNMKANNMLQPVELGFDATFHGAYPNGA